MLNPSNVYIDNSGKEVSIMGRIKNYSDNTPYVWSLSGNWYDEMTGSFIHYNRKDGHYALISESLHSISNHNPVRSITL